MFTVHEIPITGLKYDVSHFGAVTYYFQRIYVVRHVSASHTRTGLWRRSMIFERPQRLLCSCTCLKFRFVAQTSNIKRIILHTHSSVVFPDKYQYVNNTM
jgi:hypothetical protein